MQINRYHTRNWRESPALKGAGLPMFFLVDIFTWYEVQRFLRRVLSQSICAKDVTISTDNIPRNSILCLDEQMKFRYSHARRDSFHSCD